VQAFPYYADLNPVTGSLPGFYKLHPVNKQYSRRRCNVVLTRRPE
jgi:hypothetical protein